MAQTTHWSVVRGGPGITICSTPTAASAALCLRLWRIRGTSLKARAVTGGYLSGWGGRVYHWIFGIL